MCVYCKQEDYDLSPKENLGDIQLKFLDIDFDFSLWIDNNNMVLTFDSVNGDFQPGKLLLKEKIYYCPMCGRKLTNEKHNNR